MTVVMFIDEKGLGQGTLWLRGGPCGQRAEREHSLARGQADFWIKFGACVCVVKQDIFEISGPGFRPYRL